MSYIFTITWTLAVGISQRLEWWGLGPPTDFGEVYMPIHALRWVLSSSVLVYNERRSRRRLVVVHGLRRLRTRLRGLLLKWGERRN
jgi:hypothetical protein